MPKHVRKLEVNKDIERMALDDQVSVYLGSKGNIHFGGLPPRLLEYNRLAFFWSTFGLDKFKLDQCTPEWVEEIYSVHLGIERVKNQQAQSVSSVAPKTMKGKNVIVNKLL